MVFKIFLDANVILDFFLIRADYQNAAGVLETVVSGKVKGFVTPSIVHTTGYWLTKKFGAARAKEILLTLLNDVKIIELDHEITTLALQSNFLDIEDALQYYAAIHHQLDFLISADQNFQKAASPNLPVISAESFLTNFVH